MRILVPPVFDEPATFLFRVLKAVNNDVKKMAVLNREHFCLCLVRQGGKSKAFNLAIEMKKAMRPMERRSGKDFLLINNLRRLNVGWPTAFLLLMFLVVAAPAASFTASLDRDTMILGEQATLSLMFEGGQARNVPTPSVPGLQINQTGTSQSMSIVNGAMSSTITVNFTVLPQRVGEFTIP